MALGFLDLPAETRNQIYHLALVREAGAKIELWPDLYSEDEYRRGPYTLPIPRGTASEKQALLAKYYPGLLFVRKELAVGLLATCRQSTTRLRDFSGEIIISAFPATWVGIC